MKSGNVNSINVNSAKDKEHEYCLRCGRRLKNVDARILGYGIVCWKKMQVEEKVKKLF